MKCFGAIHDVMVPIFVGSLEKLTSEWGLDFTQ